MHRGEFPLLTQNIPGGAFLIPMFPPSLSFWKYIQEELSQRGRDTAIAILQYSELSFNAVP